MESRVGALRNSKNELGLQIGLGPMGVIVTVASVRNDIHHGRTRLIRHIRSRGGDQKQQAASDEKSPDISEYHKRGVVQTESRSLALSSSLGVNVHLQVHWTNK